MKKLIKDLGLPVEKIDTCKNGCMLYWKDDIDLDYYKFYGDARYKLTRELNHNRKKTRIPFLDGGGIYVSPFDEEVWRHFDRTYPDFAAEPRNVKLDLCTDGFAPYGQYTRTYSC
ncbi:UNVERIFIED_CONTAM: hypothetical protein Scaly_2644500 [Sesamum calycinum]|uniref:Uncharacterized protein n=1 Tax=Sesamum calycinum TaxID=2727403 RepID=A0AAW2J9W4_9LAMI